MIMRAPAAPIRSWPDEKILPALTKHGRRLSGSISSAAQGRRGRKRIRKRMRRAWVQRFLFSLCLVFAGGAGGQIPQVGRDTIFLRQGDRLVGKLTGIDDLCVHMPTPSANTDRSHSMRHRSRAAEMDRPSCRALIWREVEH